MNHDDIQRLLKERRFTTTAGSETYLLFQQGFDLKEFCAFTLYEDPAAWETYERNFLHPILQTAAENGFGIFVDALIWRAHDDFIVKLGYRPEELKAINSNAVSKTRESITRWRQKSGFSETGAPVLIVGDVGPRGDGYSVEDTPRTIEDTYDYFLPQLKALADSKVDLLYTLTMTTATESIGIVKAAATVGLPVAVSPTIETNGQLPDGTSLEDFIKQVDAETDSTPLFYMVNCAHPTHLVPILQSAKKRSADWLKRFKGFRANASCKRHEELDNSTELDRGDIEELAKQIAAMCADHDLRVIGGCCGTDPEHIKAMVSTCLSN